MYIRFTPKQLNKLKSFLNTVTLKAYDIHIFGEIMRALDNPIDEKIHQLVDRVQEKVERKPVDLISDKKIEQVSEILKEIKKEPIVYESNEEITFERVLRETKDTPIGNESKKDDRKIAEELLKQDSIGEVVVNPKTESKELENLQKPRKQFDEDVVSDLDSAGIFGTIDRRTKK